MAVHLKHFCVKEFVPKHVYSMLGEHAIHLMYTPLLRDLDSIRTHINKPITINDWAFGGELNYSGFRPIDCHVGAELSQHKIGKAVDIRVEGYTPDDLADYIIKYQSRYPSIRRIENPEFTPSWTHIDCKPTHRDDIHVFTP